MHRMLVALLAVTMVPLGAAQVPDVDIFPSHAEVVEGLRDAARADGVTLHDAGVSIEGRELVYVSVTDPTSDVPLDERVVTLILTQQHGNEPAGTPAAMRLLDGIVAGAMDSGLLANQVLLLWPMGNPDGSMADQRANSEGTDLNRDHVHLEQPETQALHRVLQAWDVHVGVDHHEYGGIGLGYPIPARMYDYDITTLYPRHGNVRQPTLDAATDLMYDGMWPAAEAAGFSINEYGEQTAAGIPIDHTAGGPDPGILRNNMGLYNIAGILVETFIPPIPHPVITPERRVEAHHVIMDATLAYASAYADELIAAKRASERLNLEGPLAEYIEEWPEDPLPLPVDDVNTDHRGPLALAYRTAGPVDEVMARHGLPAGVMTADGTVYSIVDERGGLLAAMLHPGSTRSVAAAEATDPVLPAADPGSEASQPSPALPLVALLGALVVLGLRRRR